MLASSVSQCAVLLSSSCSFPSLDRVHKALFTLQGVVGLRVALEDDDLGARPEFLGERIASELGAGAVVGTEKREIDAGRLLGVAIKFDIDVDHLYAGFQRFRDRGDHRFGIGRSDDNDVIFLGDEVFDRVDLRGEIALIFHSNRLEVEFVGVRGRIFVRARLHLLKELVRQ